MNGLDSTRVEQDALGESRLATVNVGTDAKISHSLEALNVGR